MKLAVACYGPGSFLEVQRKFTNFRKKMLGDPVEILTDYLRNINQKIYH
jgi:hypothetical protein